MALRILGNWATAKTSKFFLGLPSFTRTQTYNVQEDRDVVKLVSPILTGFRTTVQKNYALFLSSPSSHTHGRKKRPSFIFGSGHSSSIYMSLKQGESGPNLLKCGMLLSETFLFVLTDNFGASSKAFMISSLVRFIRRGTSIWM